MASLSPDIKNLMQIFIRVSSSLSILGSGAIIFSFIRWPHFRTSANRLVFYLSISDMIASVGTVFGNLFLQNNPELCSTQGFLIEFGFISGVFWTACMAFNLLLTIYFRYSTLDLQRNEKWYFVGNLLLSFVPALIMCFVNDPTYGRMYADSTLWCWISAKGQFQVYRLILFYGPLWIVFVFNMVCYVLIGRHVYKSTAMLRKQKSHGVTGGSGSSSNTATRYMKTTSYFLLAMILAWSFATANRIQNFIDATDPVPFLYLMHSLFTPLAGFINFVVYFLTSYTLHRNRGSENPYGTTSRTGGGHLSTGNVRSLGTMEDVVKAPTMSMSSPQYFMQTAPTPIKTMSPAVTSFVPFTASASSPYWVPLPNRSFATATTADPFQMTNFWNNAQNGNDPTARRLSFLPPVATDDDSLFVLWSQWNPSLN